MFGKIKKDFLLLFFVIIEFPLFAIQITKEQRANYLASDKNIQQEIWGNYNPNRKSLIMINSEEIHFFYLFDDYYVDAAVINGNNLTINKDLKLGNYALCNLGQITKHGIINPIFYYFSDGAYDDKNIDFYSFRIISNEGVVTLKISSNIEKFELINATNNENFEIQKITDLKNTKLKELHLIFFNNIDIANLRVPKKCKILLN